MGSSIRLKRSFVLIFFGLSQMHKIRGGSVGGYDVTPDGRAFVMTRSAHQSPTEIRVIVGWTEETKSE